MSHHISYVHNSHSEGSDLIGSNTAEADEDEDPSNEAEDWSCWVTAEGASVVGVSAAVVVAASKIKQPRTWHDMS